MKKIIWLLIIIVTISTAHNNRLAGFERPLAWSFAYINDNYSATWLNGKSENYIGADDFLTASFLLRLYWDSWRTAITYNTITSRSFNFRYDLLNTTLSKRFHLADFRLRPEFGILYKGNLAGDDIQNTWHQIRNIKKVKLPYSDNQGTAITVILNTCWQKNAILTKRDQFTGTFEMRYLSRFEPSRMTPYWSYKVEIVKDFLKIEFLNGWRFYINKQKEYSELVRSGLLSAINLKFKANNNLFVDVGFSASPTRNLMEDPVFGNGSFHYLPQMWLVFSYKTPWQSLSDFIDY